MDTVNTNRTHAYWTMGGGDNERAFRAARRHSRVVRILRIALPIVMVLTTVIVVLVTYFNPLRMFTKLPVDIGHLLVSGTKITMEQPRVAGFTSDGRAYEMVADAAIQDVTKPDIIEMKNIRAKVEMQDKSQVTLSAKTGVYQSKTEMVTLERDIVLNSSTGYAGWLSEAQIDMRKGNVVSNHPVKIKLLQGTLDGNRLEIVNQGDLIRFEGGVKMTLMLTQADAKPPAPANPGANAR